MKSLFISQLVNSITRGKIKYGWYDIDYESEASPIVIGGCGRSGTTLLYAILTSHSRLHIGFETALFTGNRNIHHIAKMTGIRIDIIKNLFRHSCCWPQFAEKVLTRSMRDNNKQRWGDKSPVNVTLIPQIFQYFPNARFIHMIRDGRDVVSSLRTHHPSFFRKDDPEKNTPIPWNTCVDRWISWTQAGVTHRGDPRYYEVRYEDLIENPSQVISKLLDWLGEPFEPWIVDKASKIKVSSHPGIQQPISNRAVARWTSDLPLEAKQLFEGQANDLLIQLGYDNNNHWINENPPSQAGP